MARFRSGVGVLASLLFVTVAQAGLLVEPYLNEQTLGVARVDVTKLDARTVVDFAASAMERMKLPAETVARVRTESGADVASVQQQIDELKKAGVSEIYAVLTKGDHEPDLFLVVPAPADVGSLDRYAEMIDLDRVDGASAVLFAEPRAAGRITKLKPAPRPDLVAALSTPAAVTITAAYNDSLMGELHELSDALAMPFLQDLRQVTVHIASPDRPLAVTVRARNPAAAQSLKQRIDEQLAKAPKFAKAIPLSIDADQLRAVFTPAQLDELLAALSMSQSKPKVSVDYLAKLNEPILKTPKDQWAWPIYREAALVMEADPTPDDDGEADIKWVNTHQQVVETIRRGAAKPQFGAPLSLQRTEENAVALTDVPDRTGPLGQSLVSAVLPYLNATRGFANVLSIDAAQAVLAKDGKRLEQDIDAMFRLSDQLRKRDVIITDLVAISIRARACKSLSDALAAHPELIADDTLARWGKYLDSMRTASDLMTYRGERFYFYDIVQRIYTEDGRLAPGGLEAMMSVAGNAKPPAKFPWYEDAARALANAGASLVSAPRDDLLARYDAIMDTWDARLQKPYRDLQNDDPDRQIMELRTNLIQTVRYALLSTTMPSLNRTQVTAERILGQQDGLRVALALEQHRRKHHAYPETLDALAPDFLASVPADRIDGKSLRYALKDGAPVIYSVGADRDDDAGRSPLRDGKPASNAVAEWKSDRPVDGDWVLFPLP